MISLYTGTVGSGKSYHALELGLQWIRSGKNVIANFPIQPPKKYYIKKQKQAWSNMLTRWQYKEKITPQYLIAKSMENGWFGTESRCLLVIDEAGTVFNSRDWQLERESRMEWIKFFSQSRKFGYDIILIVQSDRMIDRQIRGLVEYEVVHRKANNARFFKWLNIFRVSLFMYIYKWYGTRVKSHIDFSIYKQYVANRYDTFRIFDMQEMINNLKSLYPEGNVPDRIQQKIERMEEEEEKRKAAEC